MKKIVFSLMAAFVSLTFIPVQANSSASDPVKTTVPAPAPVSSEDAARALKLESRLKEIDAMDKSKLVAEEKKELRKEVKAIKHELKEVGGGVYISAGALILVLILIILL
jgi:hypothetical protein